MTEALLESVAVFKKRASDLGMDQTALDKAEEERIATLGKFGFCTSFVPGYLIKDSR